MVLFYIEELRCEEWGLGVVVGHYDPCIIYKILVGLGFFFHVPSAITYTNREHAIGGHSLAVYQSKSTRVVSVVASPKRARD
jgi:hypothetical protein